MYRFGAKDEANIPVAVRRPPMKPTLRQPNISHRADVTGANKNILPNTREVTHPKKLKRQELKLKKL